MTYLLNKDDNDQLVMTTCAGEVVSPTEVLNVYPDRKVYALHGQMGAGKTTFTKALCEAMGTLDIVNSPTFAIVNVYDVHRGDREEEFYHFDCYRLKSIQEALDLGAEEYLYSGRYCFIEWPEMIADLLPDDIINIELRVREDGVRELRM